jgi:hypothetical protein
MDPDVAENLKNQPIESYGEDDNRASKADAEGMCDG